MVRAAPPEMLPGIAAMAVIGSLQLARDLTRRALRFFGEDDRTIGDNLDARMAHAKNELHIAEFSAIAEQSNV